MVSLAERNMALAPVHVRSIALALYFFHIQTDSRFTDHTGIEFANPLEARAQAIVTCGEMVTDDPKSFWGSRPWGITVTDAQGLILWELTMSGFASAANATLG